MKTKDNPDVTGGLSTRDATEIRTAWQAPACRHAGSRTAERLRFRITATIHRVLCRGREAHKLKTLFGLRGRLPAENLYDRFAFEIHPGELVAVVGPSGAGKSVLLRNVAERTRQAVRLDVESLLRMRRPAVQAVGVGTFERRLEVLSCCGLAEASVLLTPARCLSGGQLYRLALARAILHASPGQLVIVDEFAAVLDLPTACVLANRMRKLVSSRGLAMLLATPRAELLAALQPDRVIIKPLHAPPAVLPGKSFCLGGAPGRSVIQPGRIGDYHALAGFHYVPDPPAAHKRVWVVRTTECIDRLAPQLAGTDWRQWGADELAAVAVVSPPVCNCRGRNAAVPHRYAGGRRGALRLLNEDIECISRVVVHPAFRGLGLGVALVRHALATATVPMVEALATMGAVHPLFEKAGMYSFGAFPGRRRYVYYLGRRSPYVIDT